MDINKLISEAENFAELGMPVGPAVKKRILIKEWSKLKGSQFLDKKYSSYWKNATGLGLLCGKPSGVIGLDIDLLENEDKKLLDKITKKLPPIYSGKKGNPHKRPTQFFKYNGETSRKFNNIHVEILSDGNQTIIPPSIHPDFKINYAWVGQPLTDIDIDDLPTLPEGFLEFLETLNDELSINKNSKKDPTLKKVNGRCKSGSHNKLSALGVALTKQNYPFDRLVNRLLKEDQKINHDADSLYFCCPSRPWRKNKTAKQNAEDFVEELFRNHGPGGKRAEESLPIVKPGVSRSTIKNIPALPPFTTFDKKGNEKTRQPTEAETAKHVVEHISKFTRKFGKDIFSYNETHWQLWTDAEESELVFKITELLDWQTSHSRLQAICKYITQLLPNFKENPFQPNPFVANFLDGTLEAIQKGSTYELVFRPHNPEDMCLSVIPMNYNADRSVKNTEFEEMLQRLIGDDPEKIRQIKQMYGATIMPIFPHLFLMVGQGGTGKSSVIKPAIALRDQSSMSFSDPTSWDTPFGLEPMIGKLVNVDLDIDTHKPIADSIVKKIEDRYLFPVNRKNKAVINAPIPALHIFGANGLPPTREWGSKAHNRRWTFIDFNLFEGSENQDRDFAMRAFKSCPEGVLNFALEGLFDLIEQEGAYFSSNSSKKLVKDWQASNDPISSFLNEIKETGARFSTRVQNNGPRRYEPSEVIVTWDENAILERPKLWDLFCDWHLDAYRYNPRMGKVKFFQAIRNIGIAEKKSDGYFLFAGFLISRTDNFSPDF